MSFQPYPHQHPLPSQPPLFIHRSFLPSAPIWGQVSATYCWRKSNNVLIHSITNSQSSPSAGLFAALQSSWSLPIKCMCCSAQLVVLTLPILCVHVDPSLPLTLRRLSVLLRRERRSQFLSSPLLIFSKLPRGRHVVWKKENKVWL